MKIATLQIALGTIVLAAMFARGAQAQAQVPHQIQAQAATPQLRAAQPAGPIGGGATVGTCGTVLVGGTAGGARPMRDYRRAGDLHHAVVGGLQQLAALDAAIVGALDGIVLAGPCPAPGTPYHTLAGLMAERARVARRIQEQPLEPIYAALMPPEGWTFELHVALQRIEAMARAGRLGRTEYMVLRKHLIETMAGQQQAFAAAAGIVAQGAGPHRRMQPRIIGIAP